MAEKYLREIEEILQKADGDVAVKHAPAQREAAKTPRANGRGGPLSRLRPNVEPGKIMLGGVALLLTALMLMRTAPSLVGLAFWSGLVLFLVGYAIFFIKPTNYEKRWRGRVVSERASITAKFKGLFRR